MELKKYSKFFHEDVYQATKKQLPLKLKKIFEDRNMPGDCISIDDSSARSVTGPENDEKITAKLKVEFRKIQLIITFIESAVTAEMVILVDEKKIGLITRKEGFPGKIIKALLRNVIKYIRSRI